MNRKPSGYWTNNPQNVDCAFDTYGEELGRDPTVEEFGIKYPGALGAIGRGKYHPDVKTWNDYLKHRGFQINLEIGKWTPEKIDQEVDEKRAQLGRNPLTKELKPSIINSIHKGRYHPNVHSWETYLKHRGLWNGQINSPEKLSDLLKSEPVAQHAVRLAHGDEVDLADILVVLYAGRITREDVLQFAEDPSLREYLGKFRGPGCVRDIVEPIEHILPLDKEDVIKGIMLRRLREHAREKLGPRPTQEEQQSLLEELSKEIEALAA